MRMTRRGLLMPSRGSRAIGCISSLLAGERIVSHGGVRGRIEVGEMNVAVWHGFHFASIAAAIGAAAALARLTHTWAVWPIDGFTATTVYLLGVAVLLTPAPIRPRAHSGARLARTSEGESTTAS